MEEALEVSPAKHIAVIMDGNGRWANARLKPRVFGHRQGVKSVKRVVEHAAQRRVESLTLYAFSSENWKRPETEVKLLFELLVITLDDQISDLHRNNIQLRIIGDIAALPAKLVKKLDSAIALTSSNSGMVLNIALNYGARWEIAEAAKTLAYACQTGDMQASDITEEDFDRALSTAGQAPLDLLIRTGGEKRLSNFLLWQAAYAELYFTDTYWPDFDEAQLDAAIDCFAVRQRRFGKTDAQIKKQSVC